MNTLREAVQDYLALRRSLGFKLREDGARLADFVSFMGQRKASYITRELALTWAQAPPALPSEWARRLGFVRVFARHRSATDPRTQIPPNGLLPYPSTRIRPYIYSDHEIQALLDAALKMRCRTALRPWTYYCLIGLLSVSGLRLGEALNLELQDVDLQAAVLTIRTGKFGKSRLVPLHRSTRDVLADYMARRNQLAAGRPMPSHLFVSERRKRLDVRVVHDTFNTLSQQIGLREPSETTAHASTISVIVPAPGLFRQRTADVGHRGGSRDCGHIDGGIIRACSERPRRDQWADTETCGPGSRSSSPKPVL